MANPFGIFTGKFLNFSQNSGVKFQTFSKNINLLFDEIISNSVQLPKLDATYSTLINDFNISELNVIRTLSYDVETNGIINRVGYSPIKIMQATDRNIEYILSNIDQTYNQQILQLDTISKYTNNNIYLHKLLSFLLNSSLNTKITQYDLPKFAYGTTLFNTVFRTYCNPYNNFDYTKVLSVPGIIGFVNFLKFYAHSTDLGEIILTNVYSTNILDNSVIANQFTEYLTTHSDEISSNLGNYLVNNVFMFGGSISNTISNHIKDKIKNILPQIGSIFNAKRDSYIGVDFSYSLSQVAYNNLLRDHCLKLLQSGLYVKLQDFYSIDTNLINTFVEYEQSALDTLYNYISSNTILFENLDYISFKYRSEPLSMINVFTVLYEILSKQLISTVDIFKLSKVEDLINTFKIPSAVIPTVRNYIKNNPIAFPGKGDSAFSFSHAILFKQVILDFCDSEEFKKFIINVFIPKIEEAVAQKYLIDVVDYLYVDNIICFFKVLFCQHLTETDSQGKFKLFGKYISDFEDIVEKSIPYTNFLLSDGVISSLQTNFVNDANIYYYILDSFYKSSFLSNYLMTRLSTYAL